jgi:Flp pilus assembly protein TadD
MRGWVRRALLAPGVALLAGLGGCVAAIFDPGGRASVEYNMGNYHVAAHFYTKAAERNPEDFDTQFALGWARFRTGEHEASRDALRRAIALDSGQTRAYFLLGLNEQAMGEDAAAIRSLSQAIELSPDASVLYNLRSISLQRSGQIDDAVRDLERAIELEGENGVHHYNLGSIHLKRGAYADAIQSYEAALAAEDETIIPRFGLGLAYVYLGETDDARGQFELCMAEEHESPEKPLEKYIHSYLKRMDLPFEPAASRLWLETRRARAADADR